MKSLDGWCLQSSVVSVDKKGEDVCTSRSEKAQLTNVDQQAGRHKSTLCLVNMLSPWIPCSTGLSYNTPTHWQKDETHAKKRSRNCYSHAKQLNTLQRNNHQMFNWPHWGHTFVNCLKFSVIVAIDEEVCFLTRVLWQSHPMDGYEWAFVLFVSYPYGNHRDEQHRHTFLFCHNLIPLK